MAKRAKKIRTSYKNVPNETSDAKVTTEEIQNATESRGVEIETKDVNIPAKKIIFKIAHIAATVFIWFLVTTFLVDFGLNLVDAAIQEKFGATDSILGLVMSTGVASAVIAASLWSFKDIYRSIERMVRSALPKLLLFFEKSSSEREDVLKQRAERSEEKARRRAEKRAARKKLKEGASTNE